MRDASDRKVSYADIQKIVLIYAVFAGLWILISDEVVTWLPIDNDVPMAMQTLKGWLFVGVTSTLLYLLLHRLTDSDEPRRMSAHAMLFNWKRWQVYLFALLVTLFALLIRLDIDLPFGEHSLLILFMFPIILSATIGGMGPGMLSTGLSAIAVTYIFLPPIGSFRIAHSYDLFQLGFLIAIGLLISYLSAMLHHMYHRSEYQRQKAEDHLTDKERAMQLLNSIADGSSDAIFAKDLQGRYLLFNQAAARIVGKPAAEVLGKDDNAIFKPEDAALAMNDDRRVVEANSVMTWEHRLTTTRGDTFFSTTQGPLHDTHGNITGVFGIARDITALKLTETSLRAERDTNQRYLDTVQNIMVALDDDGRITMINRYGCELLGYRETDLLGKNWFKTCIPQPEGMEVVYPVFMRLVSSKIEVPERFENQILCHDGSQRMISWYNGLLKNNIGNIVGTLSSGEDITARKIAEDQLRKLSLAVEQSPESIIITNLDAEIEYVNEAFIRNTGYSHEEVIGKNPRLLHSGKTPRSTFDEMWSNLTSGKSWEGRFYNKRKDGSEYIEHAIIGPIRQPDGTVTHYVAVEEDITQKIQTEAEIHQLAFYDTLTGLPNRALLLERMTQTLATTRRVGHHSALILLNIDRFKNVNDAGGQAMGDALLNEVSKRLQLQLREGDVLSRIGGDEFCILLTDMSLEKSAAAHHTLHVAEKIHTSLVPPFPLNNERINITASLGIVLFSGNVSDTPLDILRRANTSLHHAKTRGSGQTAFFDSSLDEIAKHRFDTERELHRALAEGELRVYLQTQVNADGKIVGAEALVRWQHPQRGIVPPAAFIPIAEESNLVIEIGNWMLTEVCRLLTSEALLDLPVRIAVNISPRQFRQRDFVSQVQHILAITGADPMHLTLEVTEGLVIDNMGEVIGKMHELSEMGIHFSMDDFGTGYSSLSYLKRLPIHELKIDKSFIQDITTDANDAALVETILAVAKHMHLKVVAEGVETAEQADFLNRHGAVIHQGYFFHRPEPAADAVTKMLNNY